MSEICEEEGRRISRPLLQSLALMPLAIVAYSSLAPSAHFVTSPTHIYLPISSASTSSVRLYVPVIHEHVKNDSQQGPFTAKTYESFWTKGPSLLFS